MKQQHTAPTEYLTAGDVARIAHGEITPSGVRHVTAGGRLRVAAITPSGVRLYQRADVEAWLAERATRRGAAA